jgi:hypothetical protein
VAIEDVVQGVQVNVKSDGVDDAKDRIGQLDTAIGNLSKTAETASGTGSGRGNSGVGSLTKAFADLSATGANAFAQIAQEATSGNITGLATLIGGRFAGSVAAAGKVLGEFALSQSSAAASNAAMAKEFGTTPEVMQGVKESFEGAGISSNGFMMLVNRMSRQVVNDYAGMMASLRTDNDTQQKATLRLQTAQENYQKSLGVPKETFAAQDQLREQKLAQIAVEDAVEAQRQTALKSIPHVTELLRDSAHAHKENTDLMEVNVGTLRKSIEYMAGSVPGHIAKGIDVLKTEFDLIKSGAINADKAYELLSSQMGARVASGLSGMDTAQTLQYARVHGAEGIVAAQAGQSQMQQAGLGQTPADTAKATAMITSWSRFTGLLGALMQKIGTTAAPPATSVLDGFVDAFVDATKKFNQGRQYADSLPKPKTGADDWVSRIVNWGRGAWDKIDAWDKEVEQKASHAVNSLPTHVNFPKLPDTTETPPLSGTPVPGSGGVTTEMIGSGPGKMIHIPEGWKGAPPVSRVTESSIGTGPGKIIQLPENYGSPKGTPGAMLPANPTQADLDKFNGRAGSGQVTILPDNPTQANIDKFNTAGESPPGSNGVAPPVTVHVSVTAPVIVNTSPAGTTAIPGTGSSTVAGKWQGGSVPGFAGGGRVRISGGPTIPGFADGGNLGIPSAWPTDNSKDPMSTQAMLAKIKSMAPKSPEEARDMLTHLVTGQLAGTAAEKGIITGFEAMGTVGTDAAVGTTLGVLSNPFGTGLLDVSPTAAGDYSAGANQEEKSARAMGAHNLKELDELRQKGVVPGFATGSIRGPGNGTSDSILARLSNGEFVMKDAAVRTYGEGFMHAINNMQIPPPKYAYGGMVPSSSLPHFSEGGAMERPGSILNLHVGGEVFSGLKAPAAVADQLRKFAINQQTTSTGKKPSWAGG